MLLLENCLIIRSEVFEKFPLLAPGIRIIYNRNIVIDRQNSPHRTHHKSQSGGSTAGNIQPRQCGSRRSLRLLGCVRCGHQRRTVFAIRRLPLSVFTIPAAVKLQRHSESILQEIALKVILRERKQSPSSIRMPSD